MDARCRALTRTSDCTMNLTNKHDGEVGFLFTVLYSLFNNEQQTRSLFLIRGKWAGNSSTLLNRVYRAVLLRYWHSVGLPMENAIFDLPPLNPNEPIKVAFWHSRLSFGDPAPSKFLSTYLWKGVKYNLFVRVFIFVFPMESRVPTRVGRFSQYMRHMTVTPFRC